MRRFNYTGRIGLRRDQVSIQLKPGERGRLAYEITIGLGETRRELDPEADVHVELRDGASFARLDLGKLRDIAEPLKTVGVLTDFSEHQSPSVWLKIVRPSGEGLLAASCKVQPQSGGASLLPVTVGPLEGEIFRVSYEDETPKLVLNEQLKAVAEGGVKFIARDKIFRALVFPQVFREVLSHFLLGANPHSDDPEDDSAAQKWTDLGRRLTQVGPPDEDDEDGRREWIDLVVAAFALDQDFVADYAGGAQS